MPKIQFRGRIYPLIYALSIKEPYRVSATVEKLEMNFGLLFKQGHVSIECDINMFNEKDHFTVVYYQAAKFVHGIVDLISFATSQALSVLLTEFIGADGKKSVIGANQPPESVRSVCVPLGGKVFGSIADIVLRDYGILTALHDLIEGVGNLPQSPIACARAIEGLRHTMAPGEEDRGKQWDVFQTNLQVTKAYREVITKNSIAPRHGNPQPISIKQLNEIISRSWTLMNRFFEFQKRGGTSPLPSGDFTLLTG